MADLVQTAANVIADAGYGYTEGIAGETIAQGQPVYLKAADERYWRADASTAAEAEAIGIALNAASAGQPIRIFTDGIINLGATLVVGETYYVSDAVGAIMPSADVSAGEFVTPLGVAISTTKLEADIKPSGVARA